MSIIRVIKDNRERFLLTDAEPFLRSDLSWEAKGLLGYLMLKPDNWEVSMKQLVKAGTAGRDQTQRILNELKTAGYMNRGQVKDPETGKFVTYTNVYERAGLNPGHTPISGGAESNGRTPSTGNQAPETRAGFPVDITSKYNYKDIGKIDHEIPGPFDKELPDKQDIHDMTVALASVCKGFANLLIPDNCSFNESSVLLLQNDATTDQVLAFRGWWEKNGSYSGQPALKSLMNDFENMLNGVVIKRKQAKPGDLKKAISELQLWLTRKININDFSSPYTVEAIKGVGESTLRGMNSKTKYNLIGRFEMEFERAKRDAQTTT